MDNLLAALSIEGWCNDHTWAILSRVLPEGATICGAPGRWGPSKSRARSTKKQRPPSTSRRNIVPHSSIFIICWCRISGMGVYKENKLKSALGYSVCKHTLMIVTTLLMRSGNSSSKIFIDNNGMQIYNTYIILHAICLP